MTDEAVVQHLLNSLGVTTLTGRRVTPDVPPEGEPHSLPYVVVQEIDGEPISALAIGPIGIERSRLQIDCWARTRAKSRLLRQRVREAMPSARGRWVSDWGEITAVLPNLAHSGYEPPASGETAGSYRSSQDYYLVFQKPLGQ